MIAALTATLLLTAACPTHGQVLAAAADAVEARYVTEAEGQRIAGQMREWRSSGRYRQSCRDTESFLEQVNSDLDLLDPHFFLEKTDANGGTGDDWLTSWRAESRTVNAGIRDVRVLEGNVGYLRISSFYPWDLARPKLEAALHFLADVDALIIDVRGNGGGDSATASHLVRALLGRETTAVQAIESRAGLTRELLPQLSLPATPLNIPVAVLIDRRSGSASEYVAYSLQAEGRAVLVGARSGGVATMFGDPIPLGSGFSLSVPESRPVNLRTGANWEGGGARPDLPGGDDPLHVARRMLEEAKN